MSSTLSHSPVVNLATGRRKKATATVRMSSGTGVIRINGRFFDEYFATVSMQNTVLRPLEILHVLKSYDIHAKVKGGGLPGQAGALSLAIARVLQNFNPENRAILKKENLLTRDSRMRERKKSGQPGARKRFQYSKR